MGSRRKKSEPSPSDSEDGGSETEATGSSKRAKKEGDSSLYQQIRDQRIKENKERMQKLGLFDLSSKLKPPKKEAPPQKPKPSQNTLPSRRSSRIQSLPPVKYTEQRPPKEKQEVEIVIPEGTNPEVYTKQQEKLLGDCETVWELNVDGYDEDGNRIYDSIKGETCHQCRQKTLGQHTSCNKCELLQGQFCGDCLYTRYGENVMEANHNPKWVCPPCRGICNCSRCRRVNGWMPTGNIYSKVSRLGFKSVAHYLIKTCRSETSLKGSGAENIVAEEISETSADNDTD